MDVTKVKEQLNYRVKLLEQGITHNKAMLSETEALSNKVNNNNHSVLAECPNAEQNWQSAYWQHRFKTQIELWEDELDFVRSLLAQLES